MNEKPNLQKVLELSRALAVELKKGVRIVSQDARLTDEGREAFAIAVRHVWGARSRGTRGELGRSCSQTWGRNRAFHLGLLLAIRLIDPETDEADLDHEIERYAREMRDAVRRPKPTSKFSIDRRTREYRQSLKPSQPPEGPRVC